MSKRYNENENEKGKISQILNPKYQMSNYPVIIRLTKA
jgi:hypothetical protein